MMRSAGGDRAGANGEGGALRGGASAYGEDGAVLGVTEALQENRLLALIHCLRSVRERFGGQEG